MDQRFARLVFLIPLCLLLMVSMYSPAWACSVCFAEDGRLTRYAYYATTIALILLPAGLTTAFVLWIRSVETTSEPPDG